MEVVRTFSLGRRKVGVGCPTLVIAELSANHGQSLEIALRSVHAAAEAGADAIKLQTYTPDTLTIDCDAPPFQVGGGTIWDGRTLYDLYREAQTPWEWHPSLMAEAKNLGLECFSTPFDHTAVDFLESLDVPAYKVASFEMIDHSLLEKIGRTGKPVIMSTGMATLAEIDEAVSCLRSAGCRELALLKCTSAYPASPADANLLTIPHLSKMYQVPVGLSDHTMGIAVPVAAVALGACIIEKHFTLSRSQPGPDSSFSAEPQELKAMIEAVRVVEQAQGTVQFGLSADEAKSRVFRRSLFVVKPTARGDLLTADNVRSIRPGDGLPPKFLPIVLGRKAARDLDRGTPLAWDCFE